MPEVKSDSHVIIVRTPDTQQPVEEKKPAPIIVIKKVVGHGGHHGGAWKVAYADFVTAMMALFIVLWLLNSSEKVKEAISAYFKDPTGVGKEIGSGMAAQTGEAIAVNDDNMDQLKDKLEQAMQKQPEFEKLKEYLQFSVTGEGLRIEMLETEKGMFFQSGGAKPTTIGEEVIRQMAVELGKLANDLVIEGHTDSKAFGARKDYTNWELSADRANAARRTMEENGLRPGQVAQIRGFADRDLRKKDDPEAASNRRISVIVRYQNRKPEAGSLEGVGGKGKPGEKGKSTEH